MKIENNTIFFKSEGNFFRLEKMGKKSNTVRIMGYEEYTKTVNAAASITTIHITKRCIENNLQDSFERTLTNISYVGEVLGQVMMVFSWRHEEE